MLLILLLLRFPMIRWPSPPRDQNLGRGGLAIPHGDNFNPGHFPAMSFFFGGSSEEQIRAPPSSIGSGSNSSAKHEPSKSQVVGRYHKQLRDYSLLMEYKKLKALAPAGVYVLPSTENLREWHGVIFLRKSYYRNGVFKFVISIPESYPEEGPRVFFVSKVFNPMISPDSGELDLSAQFPIWNPNQHYIVLVLAYIKKIFYKYEYWLLPPSQMPFNPQALALWTKNKDAFMVECERCSQLSVNRATQNEEELCLRMTDPKPTHVEVLKRIMASSNEGGKGEEGKGGGEDPRFISWFLDGVRRLG